MKRRNNACRFTEETIRKESKAKGRKTPVDRRLVRRAAVSLETGQQQAKLFTKRKKKQRERNIGGT
jgi:hypothetical protein